MLEITALHGNILMWARERNLIKGSAPQNQLIKLYEEFGELNSGIAKNNPELIKDSIGDCAVVALIMAEQLNFQFVLNEWIKDVPTPDDTMRLEESIRYVLFTGEDLGHIAYVLNRPRTNRYNDIMQYLYSIIRNLKSLALLNGFTFEECLAQAWNEIKDRKGKMIDGVFVKEDDL